MQRPRHLRIVQTTKLCNLHARAWRRSVRHSHAASATPHPVRCIAIWPLALRNVARLTPSNGSNISTIAQGSVDLQMNGSLLMHAHTAVACSVAMSNIHSTGMGCTSSPKNILAPLFVSIPPSSGVASCGVTQVMRDAQLRCCAVQGGPLLSGTRSRAAAASHTSLPLSSQGGRVS